MQRSLLHMVKARYFQVPVVLVTALLLGMLAYFSSIKDRVLFPNPEAFQTGVYTDAANGGNSEVLSFEVNDTLMRLTFQLKEGFHSPYVGLSTGPIQTAYINAGKHNEILIKIRGNEMDRVGISLFAPPLPGSQSTEETLYHSYLHISPEVKTYTIPFSELAFPDWWEDVHGISGNASQKPQLNQVLHVNIGSAFTPEISKPKTIEIYSLSFSRNNSTLFFWLISMYIAGLLLYTALLIAMHRRKERQTALTVNYTPVEDTSTNNGAEKCLAYINREFSRHDLSLEQVSAQTGISGRRITQLIQEQFQCNFKTYVNRIRITESKRLLTSTQLNMGEIADKVGFNNQSHFNRVFKAEEQMSPSKYRNQHP